MPHTRPSLHRIADMMEQLAAYTGQTVVIKIGGNSIDKDPAFLGSLAQQLEFLQSRRLHIVLVHGGGPQIDRALAAAGLVSVKGRDGRRLTSPAIMKVVAQALREISRTVATEMEKQGCSVYTAAAGVCFVEATPFLEHSGGPGEKNRVGMPDKVDAAGLRHVLEQEKIVVLNSVGRGPHGHDYNINADDYAMALASAMGAKRLVLATNVAGVYGPDKELIEQITPAEARALIADGTISGGMIPKIKSALRALETGVGGVVIIDAHKQWALLGELLTRRGYGTLITNTPVAIIRPA